MAGKGKNRNKNTGNQKGQQPPKSGEQGSGGSKKGGGGGKKGRGFSDR